MERIDVAVIGAGVSGLAAARAIAERGRTVVLLERHPRPGQDTSTHNSGVIHAGMYYPSGSLKARLCVDGRRRLYDFCAQHGVPHRKCGKLIVGHDAAEMQQLEALKARGAANGVATAPVLHPEINPGANVLVSFGQDNLGEIYVLALNGHVFRIDSQ